MASSKVMANEDLPRQSSILPLSLSELQADQSKNFGSMNIDELLKNIYGDTNAIPDDDGGGGAGGGSAGIGGDVSLPKNAGSKTVDEVWKEIVAGNRVNREPPELTLEDFLAKAGAVREEDVMFPPPPPPPPAGFGVDSMMNSAQFQSPPLIKSQQDGPGVFGVESVGFGDRIDGGVAAVGTSAGVGVGGAGRGKRRMVEEQPVDKATQQKQRRMIKNRESAARSRERKQAYTIELESLVSQLEEENATLLREEAERTKERLELLMVNLIPVVEKRRPPRVLRRTNSM